MKQNVAKKGFTLIELAVVVLIIGILATIALPQYYKATEKSRATEVLTLFGSIRNAEQRYYLINQGYTKNFEDLDLNFMDKNGNSVSSGSSFNTTNFTIALKVTGTNEDKTVATRGSGKYKYVLVQNFNDGQIYCYQQDGKRDICDALGKGSEDNGQAYSSYTSSGRVFPGNPPIERPNPTECEVDRNACAPHVPEPVGPICNGYWNDQGACVPY